MINAGLNITELISFWEWYKVTWVNGTTFRQICLIYNTVIRIMYCWLMCRIMMESDHILYIYLKATYFMITFPYHPPTHLQYQSKKSSLFFCIFTSVFFCFISVFFCKNEKNWKIQKISEISVQKKTEISVFFHFFLAKISVFF